MGNLFFSCTGQTAIAVEHDEGARGVIYDVWKSNRTITYSENLRQYLFRKGYYTPITDCFDDEFQEGGDSPIIALCLRHSRIEADVNFTLANLTSEQQKRIILIMLHYRKEDTNINLNDNQFKKQYPGITVHNCFLQRDHENIEEVNRDVCKDLARREINDIRRSQKQKALRQKT
ncbi:uncharacterized protein LOC132738404 [Ruditapes philippinarum]|uniref:uncharacterized protein LOC132738404 n=1 Tax=Ruditapes philippinarum TaxID=129788 RepID=UPI00295AA58E|nr:uncharacterized protein LOC132738404 [Ruditapes philippinarum]